MTQIISNLHFSKNNGLFIPLSIAQPSGYENQSSPDSEEALTLLCAKIEKEILINALGVTLYNELQLALPDLDNPVNAKWKSLVKGEEYDSKVWNGLDYDYSLIAYKVYEQYRTYNETQITAIGEEKPNAENSSNINATYKIVEAQNNFLKQYQGGYLQYPNCYISNGVFIEDYYQDMGAFVSFRQYLIDKQSDFEGLDMNKFKIYTDEKNTFGL